MATAFSSSATQADLNVTPLIDILLVLLIIFMVISPRHQTGDPAEIPQPSDQTRISPAPEEAIVLHVQQSGDTGEPSLDINGRSISWETLESKLREIFAGRVDRIVFVQGDPEVDFQYVAQAVDVGRHAGVSRIGLIDPGTFQSGTK